MGDFRTNDVLLVLITIAFSGTSLLAKTPSNSITSIDDSDSIVCQVSSKHTAYAEENNHIIFNANRSYRYNFRHGSKLQRPMLGESLQVDEVDEFDSKKLNLPSIQFKKLVGSKACRITIFNPVNPKDQTRDVCSRALYLQLGEQGLKVHQSISVDTCIPGYRKKNYDPKLKEETVLSSPEEDLDSALELAKSSTASGISQAYFNNCVDSQKQPLQNLDVIRWLYRHHPDFKKNCREPFEAYRKNEMTQTPKDSIPILNRHNL